MSVAAEAFVGQNSNDEAQRFELGQAVDVTTATYRQIVVDGIVRAEHLTANPEGRDSLHFSGTISQVPGYDSQGNFLPTYHVDRGNDPTFVVPTSAVHISERSAQPGIRKVTRFVISAA